MSVPDWKPTTFERRVVEVMHKLDPEQDRGLPAAFIARHVWERKKTTSGRAGQNMAMGAQLERMRKLGLVYFKRDDPLRLYTHDWFLTFLGRRIAMGLDRGFVFLDSLSKPFLCKLWGEDDQIWLFYWHADKKWVSLREVSEAEAAAFPRNLTEKEQAMYPIPGR